MDYFYFFFFLSLSVIILFKSIIKSISDWIMKSEKLNKTGLITFIIGISLTCFSLMQSLWYERLWMVVTLILGILLLIRSFFIIFFLKNIKKMLPILLKHYYKISLPISATMIFLAFFVAHKHNPDTRKIPVRPKKIRRSDRRFFFSMVLPSKEDRKIRKSNYKGHSTGSFSKRRKKRS